MRTRTHPEVNHLFSHYRLVEELPRHRVVVMLPSMHDQQLHPRKIPGSMHNRSRLDYLWPRPDNQSHTHDERFSQPSKRVNSLKFQRYNRSCFLTFLVTNMGTNEKMTLSKYEKEIEKNCIVDYQEKLIDQTGHIYKQWTGKPPMRSSSDEENSS